MSGISMAKQAEPAPPLRVRAEPSQVHESSRRLAFQPGSGFASRDSTAAKQQQGIPDLTRLMCSAGSGNEFESSVSSTSVKQDDGKHGSTPSYPLTTPFKRILSTS